MAKTTTKAAAIYTRVSTLEQVSNLSLTTQLDPKQALAEIDVRA